MHSSKPEARGGTIEQAQLKLPPVDTTRSSALYSKNVVYAPVLYGRCVANLLRRAAGALSCLLRCTFVDSDEPIWRPGRRRRGALIAQHPGAIPSTRQRPPARSSTDIQIPHPRRPPRSRAGSAMRMRGDDAPGGCALGKSGLHPIAARNPDAMNAAEALGSALESGLNPVPRSRRGANAPY